MPEIAPQSVTIVATETQTRAISINQPAEMPIAWLSKGTAMALMTLFTATWRLWWTPSTFPALPLSSWYDLAPAVSSTWTSRIICFLTLAALLRIAFAKDTPRLTWLMVCGGLLLLFLLDQHRLQPWAYQACLYGLIFSTFNEVSTRRWCRWLTASIYFYSALGKFDFQFLHTVGQQFVSLLLGSEHQAPSTLRLLLAAALPTFECLVGIGLVFPKTRRWAGAGAMTMHLGLIVALGPWWLGHSYGVLAWNAVLLIQAWFLFVQSNVPLCSSASVDMAAEDIAADSNDRTAPIHFHSGLLSGLVTFLLCLAILLPIIERSGWWDHWLSWSLYSPHTSRVVVEIHSVEAQRLPAYLQPYLSNDNSDDGWRRLSLEQWSLRELGVPIYPQARYQLKLAVHVAQQLTDPQAIRCEIKSTANRWTGQRTTSRYLGKEELQQSLKAMSWLR